MGSNPKGKGKPGLSKYFKILEEGDSVAVVREPSERASFPSRYQGRTGKIIGKRGTSYIVELKDQNKMKKFLIEPIHLKKIKQSNKTTED